MDATLFALSNTHAVSYVLKSKELKMCKCEGLQLSSLLFWCSGSVKYMELFMLRNRIQAALLPTFTCFIPPSCPCAVLALGGSSG